MATSSPKLSRRSSAPKKRSAVAVLLYVPNLIGYVRIALAFVGYAYAFDSLQVTLGAYLLSQALDVADGFAARALGQSSKFGAVLDMVTDRTSTACLCLVLSRLYPQHVPGFAGLITLDLFSHWFQMYASLAAGGERRVHLEPVAEEVKGDEAGEAGHVLRVQPAEHEAEARRRRAVRHHVEDGAELGRLAERARGEAVGDVERLREQVGAERDLQRVERVGVADERERDPHVADQVGHVEQHRDRRPLLRRAAPARELRRAGRHWCVWAARRGRRRRGAAVALREPEKLRAPGKGYGHPCKAVRKPKRSRL